MATENPLGEINRFEGELEHCTKCGFCTFFCPIYREELIESSVARGKNMLIRALLAGDLGYTRQLCSQLNKCTLCMTCTENCPVKVQIAPMIVAARADKVRKHGTHFPYNIIYRWLLPHRMLFGTVLRITSWLQKVIMPKTQGTIRHLPFFLSALGKGRHIPQIAPRFLRNLVPVITKPPAGVETKIRAGYFIGCMTDFVFPDVGVRIIRFLTRNGVEVIVPKDQGCCGAPAFLGSGDFEAGRKLADANVKAFENIDYVISDCATCGSASKDYSKFLANTPERARMYAEFSNKIYDISQFLVEVLKLPASAYKPSPEAKGKRVTWHAPCHLSRHLRVNEQPKQILKSIPDIEYVELPDAERCCGMAGTFSINYHDLSKKIADKKMEAIKSTHADILVTGCPGCVIQLIDGAFRHNTPLQVLHIMELLD